MRRRVLLAAPLLLSACQSIPIERPAPGQPTMNQLMHRRFEETQRRTQNRLAPLTPQAAEQLREKLAHDPNDIETIGKVATYYARVRHGLDDLSLWFAEQHPDSVIPFGPPDRNRNPTAYARAKAIWTSHLRRPPSSPDGYCNAATFFQDEDPARAESILQAGSKAFPADTRWPQQIGLLQARTLACTNPPDPVLLQRLLTSADAPVLVSIASNLIRQPSTLKLGAQFLDRALALDPTSRRARLVQANLNEFDPSRSTLHSAIQDLRAAWYKQTPELSAKAQELLRQAAQHPNDPLAADSRLEANLTPGKAAIRHADSKAALRYLSAAAAAAPNSNAALRAQIDLSLPRALIDHGYRTPVAAFLDQIAPTTPEPQRFHDWANAIRQGINPDLTPYVSGCTQDPC